MKRGDLTNRLRAAERTNRDAHGQVERLLSGLNPSVVDAKTLRNLKIPAKSEVLDSRDRERTWRQDLQNAEQSVTSTDRDLAALRSQRTRIVRDDPIVSAEELQKAREQRDKLWQDMRRQHLDDIPDPNQDTATPSSAEGSSVAFESAIRLADDLADRRFDHAETAGRLAEIDRKIAEQQTHLEQYRDAVLALQVAGEEQEQEWITLWRDSEIDPLSPDKMLEWLEVRDDIIEADERFQESSSELQSAQSEYDEAKRLMLQELTQMKDEASLSERDDLGTISERISELVSLSESESRLRRQLEEEISDAEAEVRRRDNDRLDAEQALESWHAELRDALEAIALNPDERAEAIGARIDIIDQMRDAAGTIRSLRYDRIEKIERDISDFESVVSTLVKEVANDLAKLPSDEAILALEARLNDAETTKDQREEKLVAKEELDQKIASQESNREELLSSIAHLKELAQVGTNEELRTAIEISDRKRAATLELQNEIQRLHEDGDGKSLEELEGECADVVIDDVAAQEESLRAKLDDLRKQLTSAAERRAEARNAFEAVGGDDAAARAAASREEAYAELQDCASRYVRAQTSSIILRWAIDRYRREKQAPLLTRAGALFRLVTGCSFEGLQVWFDEQDNPQLRGVRPNQEVVPISGMSTGTADQLYLTLRIASIEDYLDRAHALPFIADDLFINFDNERASSGFELLRELSERTQVLFFTHHDHLLDLARNVLGSSLNVVELS